MNKTNKNQKGFTAVEALLIILILAVIGLGGYYVYHTNHKTKAVSASTKSVTAAANPYAGWKSYCSTVGDICYKYPANWKFSSSFNQGPSPESDSITSPSGEVKVVYASDQIGHFQPDGGTVNVLYVDSFSSDFQQVALAVHDNDTGSTPASYITDVFITNNSSTEYSNISSPFKTGDSYTIGSDNDGAMEDRFSVGDIGGSSFTVNGNFQSDGENGTSEDTFASLTDAQNWYNSADVQTAVLILRSVTTDNQ
jgi:hypothetical protein